MIHDVLNKLSVSNLEGKLSEKFFSFMKRLILKVNFRESILFILIILFAAKAINFYFQYLL